MEIAATYTDPFPSPLRYPGGKGKVAVFVEKLFALNGLSGGQYAEPYAGGASVALSLLYGEHATVVRINDLNPSVAAFWRMVTSRNAEFCDRVEAIEPTMDEWYKQKQVQISRFADDMDLAVSTFFLNRTNRSGIILGGVIGGKNQDGAWTLGARFNKPALLARLRKIGRYEGRIIVTQMDALDFIGQIVPQMPAKSLVYLDPPYIIKGADLYQNHYKAEDHAAIAEKMARVDRPWLISYDDDPLAATLYAGRHTIRYRLAYSAAKKQQGGEVMFFSPGLIVPNVESPACLKRKSPEAILAGF